MPDRGLDTKMGFASRDPCRHWISVPKDNSFQILQKVNLKVWRSTPGCCVPCVLISQPVSGCTGAPWAIKVKQNSEVLQGIKESLGGAESSTTLDQPLHITHHTLLAEKQRVPNIISELALMVRKVLEESDI